MYSGGRKQEIHLSLGTLLLPQAAAAPYLGGVFYIHMHVHDSAAGFF